MKALNARLGQILKSLSRAGLLGFPVVPFIDWPEAEVRRLDRMFAAGGAHRRAAMARLTDADLQAIVVSAPGHLRDGL